MRNILNLRAFNLVPGVAFRCGFRRAIVQTMTHDLDREIVVLSVRYDDSGTEPGLLVCDFEDKVEAIGICVNPLDEDDWDIGTN